MPDVTEDRILFNERSNNGLILGNSYIPEEILSNIFCYYIDHVALSACHLVCKHWHSLIHRYVWHKKAELAVNHTLPMNENIPWTTYYLICDRKPFGRNLIKNHSGETPLNQDTNWIITEEDGEGWSVQCPPVGVPLLPDDPVFDRKQYCFVTSYERCWKQQIVDLISEGFSEYILDHYQPTIKVSEWYSSHKDCPAMYFCKVKLLRDEEGDDGKLSIGNFKHHKMVRDKDQNQWFKVEHQFKNYGKGLRRIRFSHGGQATRSWSGHYGSRMAGACITIEIPHSQC